MERSELASNAASAALTAALIAALLAAPRLPPPVRPEAPKPTAVTLSVVEEPPPPPPAAPPPPAPEPPPPPVQTAPSPLPPPPPPRPRHVQRPKPHPVPRPIEAPETPVTTPTPPAPAYARLAQQAPENHSAEGAYIGRLHAIVAGATTPPAGAAYRLSHPSGEALVGFILSRRGALGAVRLIRSSGSALLDAQAVAIVGRCRFPPMPEDVYPGQAAHPFSVPVNFPYTGAAEGL